MTEKLAKALKDLREVLQEEAHDHCTSSTVFFNCDGYQLSHTTRTPGSLCRDGISMRNIKGEFIK
jgi:hypothetical protein